jgi:hypothetical protein
VTEAESALVFILREELTRRRVFLSSDEEAALTRPAAYADDKDLAWGRIQRRRSTFYRALRDRFLYDGKPAEEWRGYIAEDELAAGGPTFISNLGRQVLSWSTRTGDRAVMIGGFAARMLRWLGVALALLGGWSCIQGAVVAGLIGVAAGLLLMLAGRIVGNLVADRVAALTAPPAG